MEKSETENRTDTVYEIIQHSTEPVVTEQPQPNCPFFGRHGIVLFGPKEFPHGPRLTLIESCGNQCGLAMTRYRPCEMLLVGDVPDWRACPVLAGATVTPTRAH